MARDSTVRDDEKDGRRTTEAAAEAGSNGLLDRRSYLKLAGTATAGLAAAGSVGASEDFEVIEANNTRYELDDGEVFENKIIDFSNGNWFTIGATGSNWTIRNVGFRGTHDHDENAIVARDKGGHSTIENVYLGDGCIRPSSYSSHGQVGIFVHRSHSGHLDIRNVYVEDWPNNGIYASAAAYDSPGTVTIENCFGKNNYVSSFRVSDGGEVIDCVAYNDGNGRYVGRPFWGWGDQEVVGCDFDGGPYGESIWGRDGSHTTVRDTRHNGYGMSGSGQYTEGSGVEVPGNPDLSVPDGVPTSPEEAASGGDGGGGSDPGQSGPEYTYEFVAEGEDDPTDYYFEVEEGPIEPSTYNGASIDEEFMWVSDDGTRAAGRVVDGRHAWEFDTLLVDVTVEGPAEPIINDQQSYLSRYPREGATGDDWKGDMPWHDDGTDHPHLQHTYEFVAEGEDDPTDYYFEVEEGPIEPSTYNGASIDEEFMWVSDDGARAAGRVVDGRHAWEFDTLLVDVTVEGPAEPIVNDQQSYLSRYPREGATGDDWKGDMPWHEDDLENTILLDGVGTSGTSQYEFDVTGAVEPSTYRAASITDDTEIDGGHVSGSVTGWRDAFEFSGELENLTVDGNVRVSVNDEEVDPEEYGDALSRVLTIVGNGSSATYEVSVDGTIETIPWDASDEHATVTGEGTVEGSIERGVQRFRFSGSVTDLAFAEGSAHVYADQDRVDPSDY